MPELPDVTLYIEALERLIGKKTLERVRIGHPFLLRSVEPPLTNVEGRRVVSFRRIGKRIAIGLDGDLWLVIHLMIAGRLHWREKGVGVKRKLDVAAFDFAHGSLLFTEAGTKKRASLHVVAGEEALKEHDPGGLEPAKIDVSTFSERLTQRNHTLKRALTDPRLFSGIGNAYSDEILHAAMLSPVTLTQKLTDDEIERLFGAVVDTMALWIERLRAQAGEDFPEKVTAFRKEMAAHGKYGESCPVCESPIQRIRYASNETNYCPTCQTGGRLLADRVLSRLLKKDWPRTLEELEEMKRT